MENLPPEALHDVAAYFQALSEPTRLQLLNILREGERNVGDLAQLTGTTAANVSRHMSLLSKHGMVRRESRGTSVYYSIADPAVYALCELVCGNIKRQMHAKQVVRNRLCTSTMRASIAFGSLATGGRSAIPCLKHGHH